MRFLSLSKDRDLIAPGGTGVCLFLANGQNQAGMVVRAILFRGMPFTDGELPYVLCFFCSEDAEQIVCKAFVFVIGHTDIMIGIVSAAQAHAKAYTTNR